MKATKEIKALFHLLDDPDLEVYHTVSEKIVHFGKDIIPNLEDFWEHTNDGQVQERIENIIHKVNVHEVHDDLQKWLNAVSPSLLDGAIAVAKFRYPELSEQQVRKTVREMYQACWLELNNYLTPLEQINIINSIFYSMFKFQGLDIEDTKPNHFYINDVLDGRTGNNYSLSLLYQHLCTLVDIPVFAVLLPKQYFLAYFGNEYDYRDPKKNTKLKIQFYIDPCSGLVYSQNDVDVYIKKYELTVESNNFLPQSAKQVMFHNIDSLAYVYEREGELEKHQELQMLLKLF